MQPRPLEARALALVQLSDLDTNHFGIRSARTADVTTDSLPGILEFCRNERVRFLIARCDARDLRAAHAMTAAGFDLMDALLYAERPMSDPPPRSSPPTVVRPARAEDGPIIEAIARESFTGYDGHYHADPRLDPAKSTDAYVSWALRSLSGEAADATFVGEVDGRVAGFMGLRGGETGTATIGGVTAAARRQGVYRSLIEECVRWCTAAGSKRMLISTQITNPIVTMWVRIGFRFCGAAYTFHKWFDDADAAGATDGGSATGDRG